MIRFVSILIELLQNQCRHQKKQVGGITTTAKTQYKLQLQVLVLAELVQTLLEGPGGQLETLVKQFHIYILHAFLYTYKIVPRQVRYM